MTDLRKQAECTKLARILYCPPEKLAFLQTLELSDLQKLLQSTQYFFQQHNRPLFQRLNTASNFFPASFIAFVAERTLGPLFCARIAMEMPIARAVEVARRFSPTFLASTAAYMETGRASEIAIALPLPHVLATAKELVAQQEFILMGNLVGLLPTFLIEAVLRDVQDGEALLRIAYFVENNQRLGDILEVLPTTQIRAIITAAADEKVDLWPEAISLISLVPPNWQARLMNMSADEDDNTIDKMVHSIARYNLWHAILPLLHLLTEANRRRIVNQPSLQNKLFIQQLLQSTAQHELWQFTLPLIPFMEKNMMGLVASEFAQVLDNVNLHHLLNVCQWQKQWPSLMLIVERMSHNDQQKFVNIFTEVSDELLASLIQSAQEHTLWSTLLPLLAATPENTRRRIVNLPNFLTPTHISNLVSIAQTQHLWLPLFAIAELLPEAEQRSIAYFAETFDSATIYQMSENLTHSGKWSVALRLLAFMRPERRSSIMLQISNLPDESLNDMLLTLNKENNWDLLIDPLSVLPDYASLQILQRAASLDAGLRARLLVSALQSSKVDNLLIHMNALPTADIQPHLDLIHKLPEPVIKKLKEHIQRLALSNIVLP